MITLDDITCSSPSWMQLCERIKNFGVARIPAFLSPGEIESVHEEARVATSEFANYRNPFGPCSRFSLEQLSDHLSVSRDLSGGRNLVQLPEQFSSSREVVRRDLLRNTVKAYLGPNGGFMEVVAFTRDHIPDPKAVYGKLHFDRRHQLKVIVYLNDTTEENGAFGCIPGSHHLGRELYHDGWRQTLGLRTHDPIEIERAAFATTEDQAVYRLVPCIFENQTNIGPYDTTRDRLSVSGRAGTLVVFDTHLLHYGGSVRQPGAERWTLKGHSFGEAGLESPTTAYGSSLA